MTYQEQFKLEGLGEIEKQGADKALKALSIGWINQANIHKYSYHFEWQGRPIIQYPQDMVAMQELIWTIKPDLIIETGIAHGGSLIFSASMLALLDMTEAIDGSLEFDPKNSRRKVLGIDIDIRAHNRQAIEAHSMASRIQLIQGSSIDPDIIKEVKQVAKRYERVLVCLDSNHTHEHVLAELHAYASLTSKDSYCVVFDTVIEDMPSDMFPNRPWGVGNNPKTAVIEFLQSNKMFVIDKNIENKLQITVAPSGYLRRVST